MIIILQDTAVTTCKPVISVGTMPPYPIPEVAILAHYTCDTVSGIVLLVTDADIHLLMDEVLDDQLIGRDMNGTIGGGAPLVPGVWGNALSFNGIDQYVQLDSNFCFSQEPMCPSGMTWSVWVYLPSAPNSWTILMGAGHGALTYYTGIILVTTDSGQLAAFVKTATHSRETYLSAADYIIGEWMHVGIIYQPGEDVKVYINGSPVVGQIITRDILYGAGGLFDLGRSFTDAMYAEVTMDELLFWSHAKDDAFMEQIFNLQNL